MLAGAAETRAATAAERPRKERVEGIVETERCGREWMIGAGGRVIEAAEMRMEGKEKSPATFAPL
jgi:hypothetical protein